MAAAVAQHGVFVNHDMILTSDRYMIQSESQTKKVVATESQIRSFGGVANADNDVTDASPTLLEVVSAGRDISGAELKKLISANGVSKADVLRMNSQGRPILIVAIQKKMPLLMAALLEMGADVQSQDPTTGWTPLMFAVAGGNISLVKQILALGVDVDIFAKDDWNALSTAIMQSQEQIADLLADAGACFQVIKKRHPFAHEQYLQAQREYQTRKTSTKAKPAAMYVRDYDQYC